MSTEKKINVAVVGGGIGGLCAAIGLLNHPHVDVQVYEAAHKFAEIGAGVAFGPNSQRAMAMIDPKIYDAYLSQATHNGWSTKRNEWFQFRMGMEGENADEEVIAPQNETGQSTVHRALFLDELVKLVPPEIAHFGKRLIKIDDRGESGVQLLFLDGSAVTVDAVIGADGVHSPTRKYLLGENHPVVNPKFTGSVAYRALVPMDEARKVLPAEYAENSIIWMGKSGGVMIYPISFGDVMNVVAMRSGIKSWDDPKWVIPATKGEARAQFQGWSKFPSEVIELVEKCQPSVWSMWDYDPAPYYNKGRVCMMGDAAHASLPYQGAGAGMAIEDALVLHTLLGRVSDARQIEIAFQAYNTVRLERDSKVTTTSREAGSIVFMELDEAQDSASIKPLLDGRMKWVWEKDLHEQNQEALKVMDELSG